jgi:hypothetical protein
MLESPGWQVLVNKVLVPESEHALGSALRLIRAGQDADYALGLYDGTYNTVAAAYKAADSELPAHVRAFRKS